MSNWLHYNPYLWIVLKWLLRLVWQAYHKIVKNMFSCTYLDQMIIQLRFMFCSKFSFKIFLLIFFPLFSKFFTCILKIYELPKMDNSKILPNTCLNNNHPPGQFYVASPSDFWTIALLTLQKMCTWKKRTLLH